MLKEVCSIKMGQSPASDSYNDNGEGIPFFKAMLTLVSVILWLGNGVRLQ